MSSNITGSFTLHFKENIPDKARIIPNAQTQEEDLTIFLPFASVTPRVHSVEIAVNGDSFDFSDTISHVKNSEGKIVFETKKQR